MMTMTKTTVQLGDKACILVQSTCTAMYQVTTHVKQSICIGNRMDLRAIKE